MKYVSTNAEIKARCVKPGEYLLTILEAVETISKSTGDEMIKLKLEVEGHGATLYEYLVSNGSSAWKIDSFRRALGERVVEGEEVEIDTRSLVGRQARAKLRVETYQGKDSNKVDYWLSPQLGAAPAVRPAPAPSAKKEDGDEPF
jgi:hypothetical protein